MGRMVAGMRYDTRDGHPSPYHKRETDGIRACYAKLECDP